MNKVDCLYCDNDLDLLPDTHPEYKTLLSTSDGTRKWYICNKCAGVFCKDKQTGAWYVSPETYDRFISEGKIKDRLEG